MGIFFFLGFLVTFQEILKAEDLGFRYNSQLHACFDSTGKQGYNPNFHGECGNLKDAILAKVIWQSKSFAGANLYGVDLTGANLKGSNLVGVDLTNANLVDTSLAEVDLTGASLIGAKLLNVNFTRTNLQRADLRQSNICKSDLIYEMQGWTMPD